jgi:transglutaminase-like putative cysteine protease
VWACDAKRGNCTDFHSPFIGMLRADGIPARFDIGFPLPENKDKGDIAGYHCRAEFYARKTGWIPVDISEAWKAKQKQDYFFGSVDANRVQLSTGRDVILSPRMAQRSITSSTRMSRSTVSRTISSTSSSAFEEVKSSE